MQNLETSPYCYAFADLGTFQDYLASASFATVTYLDNAFIGTLANGLGAFGYVLET
jgi:hypothetical protein